MSIGTEFRPGEFLHANCFNPQFLFYCKRNNYEKSGWAKARDDIAFSLSFLKMVEAF